MFVFKEAGYQLFRSKGRSILLACISALLCGCVAFYVGNISSNQYALEQLSETTPATVTVTNMMGDDRNIDISTERYGLIESLGSRDIRVTTQVRGAWSEEAREQNEGPFTGGDVELLALNCYEAGDFGEEDTFSFAEGYDASLLEGQDGLCLVSEGWAQENGVSTGDELTMPAYLVIYNGAQLPTYTKISELTMRVAGTFDLVKETAFWADIYVPTEWLKAQVEAAGVDFNYNSFTCKMADSMRLNEYKEGLIKFGFGQIATALTDPDAYYDFARGDTISTEDEMFIKTAEKLGNSLLLFKNFMVAFFVMVTSLVTLAIFLVLRSSRRDMAISCSLGRPKVLIGAANLIAVLAAEIAGCVIALPFMVALAGMELWAAGAIVGAFMLCALAGDLIGLVFLLRFDAMSLLIQSE